MERHKPKLRLCCITNPSLTSDNKLLQWCCYCEKGICKTCIDAYLAYNFYHHIECLNVCPHTDEFHNDNNSVQPRAIGEYT